MPRLRARSINRRFGIAPERLGEVLADARLILAGSAAARALAWDFPSPSPSSDEWPLEAYVAEGQPAVFEQYQLERDEPGELLLRSVTEPWPFPPHTRVVPPSNARVIGVVEGGLGAQRAPVLGLFFDATARVLDVQAGQDPVGDDAGSKASRRVGKDPAIDEELNTSARPTLEQLPADAQESRGKRLASAVVSACEASHARRGR
ncbi:MAG: hypothetical protein M3069_30175 [Chloroflexota bacterium]|nr:hypothetical protein [Chloroflexota bacterium]